MTIEPSHAPRRWTDGSSSAYNYLISASQLRRIGCSFAPRSLYDDGCGSLADE